MSENKNDLINLSDHHPFFASQTDIVSSMGSTLSSYGIKFFEHLRVYNNGQFSLVSNHNMLIKYVFKTELTIIAPVDPRYVKNKFNYFILPIERYIQGVHHVISHFNLAYFVNFVERYPGYVDVYCFGADANNPAIMNFYLHQTDKMHSMIHLFKDTCTHLIKKHDKHKQFLTSSMMPSFTGLPNISPPSIIHLSKRELECLRLLRDVYTAKNIAQQLGISARTVESYLENIKNKLGYQYKSDLLQFARENQLNHPLRYIDLKYS